MALALAPSRESRSLLEPSCGKRVHSHTDSAWGGWGGGDTIGGGGVGEPRTGIIYILFGLKKKNIYILFGHMDP